MPGARTGLRAASSVILPVGVLLVVGLLTPVPALFPHQGDVELYRDVAARVVAGRLPYRDFLFPYPPLALVPMVVPYLLWPGGQPSLDAYHWLFIAWESALLAALAVTVRRIAAIQGPGAPGKATVGWRFLVLTVACALPIAWRFDLAPTLLTAAALLAALEDRAAAAGVALGLGVLTKLYPAVLVPVLAARWVRRREWPKVGWLGVAFGATLALVALPFVVTTGMGALQVLDYQNARGLQLESIGSGLVLLASKAGGPPAQVVSSFSSMNLAGSGAGAWLTVLPWLTAAVFGLVAMVGLRRARADLAVAGVVTPGTIVVLAAAAIVALLVTNKVFSTQYVVWLVPFAALLRPSRFWIAVIAIALSSAIHPLLYDRLIAQDPLAILVLNARNALLVVLLVAIGLDLWHGARPARARGVSPETSALASAT